MRHLLALAIVLMTVPACGAKLPDKCKLDDYKCTPIRMDSDLRVFDGGWIDFVTDIKVRKPLNERHPTRELTEQITAYQSFADDGLVGLRIAVFTTDSIRIMKAKVYFGSDPVPVVCNLCYADSKTDPYKWGTFNLPPRVKKPAVFVVLVPSQYHKMWVTAIELLGGES